MPVDSQIRCDVFFCQPASVDALDSLTSWLQVKGEDRMDVVRTSRAGDKDTLGPVEIIAVTIAGAAFVFEVIKWAFDWQKSRKEENRETTTVVVETTDVRIEIHCK